MDSSTSATAPKKEKKGLSKAWRKLKDSFKSKPSSSTSTGTAQTPAASSAAVTSPSEPEPTKAEETKPTTTQPTTTQPAQSTSDADRRLEKAKAIFKKYDFDFNDADWEQSETRPKQQYERVQKPIRMRVKYTCHLCRTVYGHDRICVKCGQKRGPESIRYPPKKKKAPKTAEAKDKLTTDTAAASSEPAAQPSTAVAS